jgi:hypothetical protein
MEENRCIQDTGKKSCEELAGWRKDQDGKEMFSWTSQKIYFTKMLVGMGTCQLGVRKTRSRESKRGRIQREKNSNARFERSNGAQLVDVGDKNTKEKQSEVLVVHMFGKKKVKYSVSDVVQVEKIDYIGNTTNRLCHQIVSSTLGHSATSVCTIHVETQFVTRSRAEARPSNICYRDTRHHGTGSYCQRKTKRSLVCVFEWMEESVEDIDRRCEDNVENDDNFFFFTAEKRRNFHAN